MQSTADNRRAVLVGIDDYTIYTRSVGSGEGFSLTSSINDVKRMWQLVRRLGYAPENVMVLSAPLLSAAELGEGSEGVHFQGATCADLWQAAVWLADGLKRADGVGWFSYSGHGGMESAKGELLCPSDVCRGAELGSLENAVSLRELNKQLQHAELPDGLTMVLDCCFTRRAQTQPSAVVRSLSISEQPHPIPIECLGARAIAAAAPGMPAYERMIDGTMQGLLCWSLSQVLGQMEVGEFGGVKGFTIGVTPLVLSAQQICRALYVDQVPHAIGSGSYAPFGGPPGYAQMSAQPNNLGAPLEIWPGANGYAVFKCPTSIAGSDAYVTIAATGVTPPTGQAAWFTAGQMIWWLPTNATLPTTAFSLLPVGVTTLPGSTSGFVSTSAAQSGYQASTVTVSTSLSNFYEIRSTVGYAAGSGSSVPTAWWNVIGSAYLLGQNCGAGPNSLTFDPKGSVPSGLTAYPLVGQ